MGFSIASSNRHASAIFKRPAFSALVMAVVVSGCTTGSLSTVYYDVPGTELKQAFKQVSLHGPNNGKAIGQAAISMELDAEVIETSKECRLRRARIDLDMKVTLPRFTDANKSNAKTRAAFRYVERHVKEHEQVHVEIARRHVRMMERELRKIPPQPTCKKLRREVDKVLEKGGRAHDREQRAFDAEHG